MDPAQTLLGIQPAPRSLKRSPGTARFIVPVVYRVEAVLESCLDRGYVPEAMYSFHSTSYLMVEIES